MSSQKYLQIFAALSASIMLFFTGALIGYQHPQLLLLPDKEETTQPLSENSEVDMELFWEVWEIAQENHVDSPVSDQELLYGAINGMLNYGYNDEFSFFFKPEFNDYKNEDLQGSFAGVGIELTMRNGNLTIITPLKGTPGQTAGLQPSDIINTIDGTTTKGLTVLEAVMMIRGQIGTDVELGITRIKDDGTFEDFAVVVTRDTIDVESVAYEEISPGIYLVDVRNFAADTIDEWDQVMDELEDLNPQGLILDLRNNSGGYVNAAEHMVSEFIPEGNAFITELAGGRKQETPVTGQGRFYNVPLIVLTNAGTASSAEIVAGALQDYERAQLIGTRTFGKGVMQQMFPIDVHEEGSDQPVSASVHIVIAKWYTPLERWVHHEGLLPDIEVQTTFEQYEAGQDPILEEAQDILKTQ